MTTDTANLRALLERLGALRVEAINEVICGEGDYRAMIVRDDEPGVSSILAQQLQDQTAEDLVEAVTALETAAAEIEALRADKARLVEAETVLAEIVSLTTVGKPGSAVTRSKYGSYPAVLYHRARAALSKDAPR
jgi:hypothetical protein